MKKKDPPGYPGDEVVKKAVGEALREIRLQKGLSLEEANALFKKAKQEDSQSIVPASLGHCGKATPGKTKDVAGAIEPRFWIGCALHRNG